MIAKLNLGIANAYLVAAEGGKVILVDTGAPNSEDRLLKAMAKHGFAPGDLALILLTHAHSDHAGSAKALRERTGARVAVHVEDVGMLQRGNNGAMLPTDIEGRLFQPLVDRPFPGLAPDLLMDTQTDPGQFGLNARLLHTPGHSPGSISLVFPDGNAIIGDILRGGLMGGVLLPGRPTYPFFLYNMADKAVLYASIRQVLNAGAGTMYTGHGGPLARTQVEGWLGQHA